jgi:hypothetical protein
VSPEQAVRARRTGTALIALAFWLLLAAVIWACFFAPMHRSLAATLTFLVREPRLVAGVSAIYLSGGMVHLLASAGRRRLPGTICVLAALAWLGIATRAGAFGGLWPVR